jgi:hypothetical protein
MTELLLFAILLCLCRPLRTFLAAAFWILLLVVVWSWPSAAQEAIARSRVGNVLTFAEPAIACRDFAEARAVSFGAAAADTCSTFPPEAPVRIVKIVPADRFQRRVWLCVIKDAPIFAAPILKSEIFAAEARECYWIHANARPRG